MEPTKVVVWDKVGNVLWGMRSWDEWEPRIQKILLEEDADAQTRLCNVQQLFANHNVQVVSVASAEELDAEIADADFLIAHKVDVPADVLRKGKRLRLVQHLGLDYRGVPLHATHDLGVPIAATPLVNYIAVAEHVWALILNHVKRLPELRAHMDKRDYRATWGGYPGVKMLRDLKLGLLGFGEIGRPVARVARAFEMQVIYWDIKRFPELEQEYGITYASWEDVFSQSDVLTVQLALNPQTEKIIGARELSWMKPDVLFVNTARGKLVDQPALTDALRQRRIGGAAIDAFAEEPLPENDPLLDLHTDLQAHVTLTPHCAWQSPWTWVRDSREIWDNVMRVIEDQPVHFLVDDGRERVTG